MGITAQTMFKTGNFLVGLATGLILPWFLPATAALQLGISVACVAFCAMNAWGLINGPTLRALRTAIVAHRGPWALYGLFLVGACAAVVTIVAVTLRAMLGLITA